MKFSRAFIWAETLTFVRCVHLPHTLFCINFHRWCFFVKKFFYQEKSPGVNITTVRPKIGLWKKVQQFIWNNLQNVHIIVVLFFNSLFWQARLLKKHPKKKSFLSKKKHFFISDFLQCGTPSGHRDAVASKY